MTPQDMLDYALGRLDPALLRQTESDLGRDTALREKCDCLKHSLRQLLDDGLEPPPGLCRRTIQFVAESQPRRKFGRVRTRPTWQEFVPQSVPFRFADLAVAAGILFAGIITLLPALHRGRDAVNQAGCMFNLHQIGLGLGQYANTHRSYPTVAPNEYTLIFAVKLEDAGCHVYKALGCPCAGPCDESNRLDDRSIEVIRHPPPTAEPLPLPVRCDYAYNVGSRTNGRLAVLPASHPGAIPLVADRPGFTTLGEIHEGNSPNHCGRGQNILYDDLSVRWTHSRQTLPRNDDLYLNQDHRPGYGINEDDVTLVPGTLKPLAH